MSKFKSVFMSVGDALADCLENWDYEGNLSIEPVEIQHASPTIAPAMFVFKSEVDQVDLDKLSVEIRPNTFGFSEPTRRHKRNTQELVVCIQRQMDGSDEQADDLFFLFEQVVACVSGSECKSLAGFTREKPETEFDLPFFDQDLLQVKTFSAFIPVKYRCDLLK